MIKYIGSKRALVPLIERVARRLPVQTACDLFAGTTRVGQALRRLGIEVLSNDTATYSEVLGLTYIVADETVDRTKIRRVLRQLSDLPGEPGYFTQAFCIDARYFQARNGARIDAIRGEINKQLNLNEVERGIVLTSLMEAADRVDSTTGLQMAYLKSWAPRAYNELELREPEPVPGPPGSVSRENANVLAPALDVDLVYIDPPYNQHSYFSNYHVWETLIRWDAPETYGIANKRMDCRSLKSDYNFKRRARAALDDLLNKLNVPWMIVSFNNEGYQDPAHLFELLSNHGYVNFVEVDFKRYVGAQIGIYNPRGEKVGAISHLRNKEVLFVVGPDRALVGSIFGVSGSANERVLAGGQAALF